MVLQSYWQKHMMLSHHAHVSVCVFVRHLKLHVGISVHYKNSQIAPKFE
jgi:hypothetical protein